MSEKLPHLGHALFQAFSANPDKIYQVDAATGQSATYGDTLKRSKLLATCFQSLAYKPGDVLALSGENHLDLYIPYYAGLACGLPIAGIDPLFKYEEIKAAFNILRPKIAFCEANKYEDTKRVVADLQLDARVVSFSRGPEESTYTGFLDTYGDEDAAEKFVPVDFNGDETFAWLVGTSGTSGLQKYAAYYHTPLVKLMINIRRRLRVSSSPPGPGPQFHMNLSTIQWMSAMLTAISLPLVNCGSQLMTSAPLSVDHIIDIINKYKPATTIVTPTIVTQLLKSSNSKDCDLTCFTTINIAGCPVPGRLLQEMRARVGPKCTVANLYGQTECLGMLTPAPDGPIGSCGVPNPLCQIKLVDPETNEEVTEPGKPGELWSKNESRFVQYYRNPTETAKVITPDGWLRTGDLMYRDENNYYFFVERLKMLIKYRGYDIVPLELESVIQTLPGVEQVAVTSVEDDECGELPVAVVVRGRGAQVTPGDVEDIVVSKLSDSKKLTGGVVFVDALPYTSSGKIARAKLKQLVKNFLIKKDHT